jgi:hypothetical protein
MNGNRVSIVLGIFAFSLGTAGFSSAAVQECVVGTNSLHIGERVTTSGGIASDSLDMEAGSVANGGANINNVNGAQVRISGGTINGAVSIAGAAPSIANGELVNGGKIVGTVTTGAGVQAVLPTHTVPAGTAAVTVNSNSAPRTIVSGNYGVVTISGSSAMFIAGTYNLASLAINAGAISFNTSGGPIAINVQGIIAVNGGTLSAGNAANVAIYSDSSASNAITVNSGIAAFPGTLTAPNGNVTIGGRVTVNGCVRGKNVDFEPDSLGKSCEALSIPTDGSLVSSQFNYASSAMVNLQVSGQVVWGGCDPVNCPNGASCNFTRFGDAQFHSDNCFTGSNPTFTTFNFPIQLFIGGGPLPSTPFAPSHVYSFSVPGNGGPFVFNYSDIPGDFGDNSGSFAVTICSQ